MISIRGVSHRYGDKVILENVDLNIAPGGVTALVGANGAGKSTLLNLVARLMPLQRGRITVDGLDVGKVPGRDLARKLAILPQTQEVAPRLTVTELVGFGRYPHHHGRPRPEDRAMIDRAIETLGLTAIATRPLDSLSGGQRQRAFVAMIFAQDTEYVLLDEPLNNLDIAASRSLLKVLRMLAEAHGRTVVIVLHDMNYASAYADQMVTMIDGRISKCGSPREILSDVRKENEREAWDALKRDRAEMDEMIMKQLDDRRVLQLEIREQRALRQEELLQLRADVTRYQAMIEQEPEQMKERDRKSERNFSERQRKRGPRRDLGSD